MDFFNYKNGELYCEGVPAAKIAADVGTPAYVYSKATFLHHYRQIADAFAPVNATDLLLRQNLRQHSTSANCWSKPAAGMDVTSGGELFRALKAGVRAEKNHLRRRRQNRSGNRRRHRRRHRGI